MKFVLICLAVVFAAASVIFGELAWISLVCAFALWVAYRSDRFGTILLAFGLSAGILTAQFAGYKFYGSPTIHDNRPLLHSPRQMDSLALPNTVLTTDGGRLNVRGVVFDQRLLEFSASELQVIFLQRSAGEVHVEADPVSPSGVVFERRCDYFCGNTFFPTFFPRRLPAYSRTDLGKYLVECRLATRTDSP